MIRPPFSDDQKKWPDRRAPQIGEAAGLGASVHAVAGGIASGGRMDAGFQAGLLFENQAEARTR